MANQKKVAQDILDVIGNDNIVSFTNCMTRLRVKANPNFDVDKLKSIDGVLGLVMAGTDEFQIVLGPGFVNKVALEFQKITNIQEQATIDENLDGDKFKSAKELAKNQKLKMRGSGSVRGFLSKISKVFTPLIPAFIGAGLLSGIAGILASTVDGNFAGHDTLKSWNQVISILLTILTNVFIIAVGWRMGEEWGGNPGITALTAAMFCTFVGSTIVAVFVGDATTGYNFLGMHISADSIDKNWFTVGFVSYTYDATTGQRIASLGSAHAGLIGAMISVAITIQFEKLFRKFMPGAIDTIMTPIFVLILMLFINFFLVAPIAGYLFTGIAYLFNHLYSNPFGAAFLAGIFLFALAFGVHQGFLPVYFALIADTGVNGLFPIMCMGGVAQVGVSIGMWFLAGKGSLLRKQISGAIIPGFLGIGEPLIYGIALPRVKPFVISCFAAAVGGFYMGAMNAWAGMGVGMNAATGPGGLTAAIMMTTIDGDVVKGILVYLSAVGLTYIVGAAFCFFGYSKISRHGSEHTKLIFKNKEVKTITKVGYAILFCTIIGYFGTWVYWYIKMPELQREEIKNFKLV